MVGGFFVSNNSIDNSNQLYFLSFLSLKKNEQNIE